MGLIKCGLVSGMAILVVGMIVNNVAMKLSEEISNDYKKSSVMREMNDPRMILFFLSPFIQGLIQSFVRNK